MSNSKKLLCVLLSLVMVLSVFTVAAVPAGAYSSVNDYSKMSSGYSYNPSDSYTVDENTPYSEDAILACGGKLSETQTIYFQAPADWANKYNTFDGPDDSEPYMHVCAYWWSGIAGSSDKGWPSGKGCAWVGYQAHLVDKANRIYAIKMPNDGNSPVVIWNNGVNGGMNEKADIFQYGRQIMDANTEGAYEGDYDTLPEGSPTQDDFDGCIQIIDYTVSQPNPLTGFDSYGSNWYVYYGKGCYGAYSTTSDHFTSKYDNCLNPEHLADPDKYHPNPADVNRDKVTDVLDAELIQKYLVKWEDLTPIQKDIADVDRDSYISAVDSTRIHRYTAGICEIDGTGKSKRTAKSDPNLKAVAATEATEPVSEPVLEPAPTITPETEPETEPAAKEITVTADKTTAVPGEEITFTVTIGPVTDMATITTNVVIPEGLTLDESSISFDEGAFNAEYYFMFSGVNVSGNTIINDGAGNTNVSTTESFDAYTFKCTVNDDAKGTLTVGFDDASFRLGDEVGNDLTDEYTCIGVDITVGEPVSEPVSEPETEPATEPPTEPPTELYEETEAPSERMSEATEPTQPATHGPEQPIDPTKIYINADGDIYEVNAGGEYTYTYYLNNGGLAAGIDATTKIETPILQMLGEPEYPLLTDGTVVDNKFDDGRGNVGALQFTYSSAYGADFSSDYSMLVTFTVMVADDAEPGVYKISTKINTLCDENEEKQIFNGTDVTPDKLTRREGVINGTWIRKDITEYTVNNGEHTIGYPDDLLFTVNGAKDDEYTYSKFRGLYIDDQLVGFANYDTESGSLKLTLKAGYMDTLEVGEHIMKYVFSDGTALGTLFINNYGSPSEQSSTPGEIIPYYGDGVIYFDAASAGWSGAKGISFYIYEIGGANVTEWGAKNKQYTSNDGDTWAFKAAKAGVQVGKEYGIIFENLDTTAQTADLLFNASCFGDTAYVPNPNDKIENAVDSNKKSMKAAWKNSSLGAIKQITSLGNIVGDSIPSTTSAYQMMVNFLASKGSRSLTNALSFNGKDAQTTIDETASALGLSKSDVEKAIREAAEIGANDGSRDRTDWSGKWDAYRSYLPEDSGGGVGGLVNDMDTIYVDLTAVNELAGEGAYVYCSADGFLTTRVDANTLSVKIPNGVGATRDSVPVYQPDSTITITVSGRYEKQIRYDDWWYSYSEKYYFDTYPCLYDHSCDGDTLVIEKNKIDYNPATSPSETYYSDPDDVTYAAHWKNSDNSKYGMVKMLDSDGKAIGNCLPNFFGRIEQIKKYINNTLPKLSGMTWDSDQELIDAAAAEIGLKKADLALLLKSSHIDWKEEDCTLPDGYSYDEGAYYLKEKGSAKPIGYYEFLRDSRTGYYVVNVSGYRPYLYNYSKTDSDVYDGSYEYSSVPKFDVVQYGSDGKFKTVSKESLSTVDGYLYFFDPDEGTFGYNTYGELGDRSGGESGKPIMSDEPILKNVKTEVEGLKVTWEAPQSIGADWGKFKYRVYIKGDTDWVKIEDTSDTSYLYKGAVSGNAYTFTVRCVSADGTKLLGSYDKYGISGRYLAAPEITKILSTARGNELTWDPVPGNVRYRVKAKVKTAWKDLGDTYDTSFIHSSQDGALAAQKGVEYTYTVECVSYDGSAVTSDYNKTGWAITYTGEDSVGVKVSGKITSYLSDTEPISVLLMQDGKVKKNVNVKGNSAEYTFDDVEAGKYTLTVSKANHVTAEYTVTVADEDITQDVEIYPLGDVTGDGKTNVQDCTAILRYVRKLDTLSNDQLKLGDVTGDDKVNVQDVTRILRHVRRIEELY